MSESISEEAVERGGPTFDPPLYIQRYVTVRDVLYKIPGIEKIADLGCAEGKFIKYLKNLPFATEIACVDVHKPSLYTASQVSRPAAWDFIFKRYKNLYIKIFHGSALEKDFRLNGYDAVTCIELYLCGMHDLMCRSVYKAMEEAKRKYQDQICIEHLDSKDLMPLVTNIFSFIRPKVAMFTTPNSEFNVLFPQVREFRHWDHKFEWTRSQFAQWCESIVREFPDYTYEIQGIGDPPSESSNLGCCSQLAIFHLKLLIKEIEASSCCEKPYELIEEHVYPGRNEDEN